MQKLGIKDSLPGLLAIGFFLPSTAFVRRFFLCIFVPLILLFSVLFCVFFLYLFGNWDGRRQRCWSFYAQPVVTTSEDSKNDGHLVLVSVLFLSFCWCFLWRWWGRWWWRHVMLVEFTPLPLCFSTFDSVVVGSFSRYSSLFFSSFSYFFLFFRSVEEAYI